MAPLTQGYDVELLAELADITAEQRQDVVKFFDCKATQQAEQQGAASASAPPWRSLRILPTEEKIPWRAVRS